MLSLTFGIAPKGAADGAAPVLKSYGLSAEALVEGPRHIISILSGLTEQLRQQKAAGSPYMVGEGLSACDVYWACFSLMFRLLPQELSPFPELLRHAYTQIEEAVSAAIDPILIEHRDHIFLRHIGLPLEY